ncbi:MAG: outer membrane protein assembly factor BamB [Gammaproteobacteria bacterium]|nr:outer membrane protein assembly factor BamB [Gammaproteobacteria bacterium]
MKTIRLVLTCVMALSIAACGSKAKKTDFFVEEVAPKKPKVTNQTQLVRNWRVDLGRKIDQGDAIISPGLLGDYLYAASAGGRVEKISTSNGKRVWQKKFKKEIITAGVGVGSGLVLVATDQGIVYALNQTDGSISWQAQLSSEILASPVAGGDVVVARTGDGKVYGLAAFDGAVLWTISRQLPRLTLRGDSRPLVYGGAVFTGFSDGTLAAVEAKNGRALWDFPISFPRGTSEIDRLADIDTNPLLVGNNIYVSSYQEVTHALDIKEQRIKWSADVSSFHSLAYDAAHLYISDKQGVVHQLDRADGKKLWSQDGLRLRDISAPISVGPYVVVSDGESGLYVMDKRDGRYLGRHKLGAKNIVGEPIVDSDTIYFVDSDGNLQSLSIVNKS